MALKFQSRGSVPLDKAAARSSVPVGEILKAEADALSLPAKDRKDVRRRYERYSRDLATYVSAWLGFGAAERPQKKALAAAVRDAGEFELFCFVSATFQKDFKATFKTGKLLSDSVRDNVFNCYSSTVLISDVLVRLGKPMRVIMAPGHVLLAGNSYAFETSVPPLSAVFPKPALDMKYNANHETGMEGLLAVAYDWSGETRFRKGDINGAFSDYHNAVVLDPLLVSAWDHTGMALYQMGLLRDALTAFGRARSIDPGDGTAFVYTEKILS